MGQNASYWNLPVAQLELNLGRPVRALACLDEFIDQARSVGEHLHLPELYRLRAHCKAALFPDGPNEARADIERSISEAKTTGAKLFEFRATVDYFELFSWDESAVPLAALEELMTWFQNHESLKEYRRARRLLNSSRVKDKAINYPKTQ